MDELDEFTNEEVNQALKKIREEFPAVFRNFFFEELKKQRVENEREGA